MACRLRRHAPSAACLVRLCRCRDHRQAGHVRRTCQIVLPTAEHINGTGDMPVLCGLSFRTDVFANGCPSTSLPIARSGQVISVSAPEPVAGPSSVGRALASTELSPTVFTVPSIWSSVIAAASAASAISAAVASAASAASWACVCHAPRLLQPSAPVVAAAAAAEAAAAALAASAASPAAAWAA